jgi:hypothetical protein
MVGDSDGAEVPGPNREREVGQCAGSALQLDRFEADAVVNSVPEPLLAIKISLSETLTCPSKNWICSSSPPAS